MSNLFATLDPEFAESKKTTSLTTEIVTAQKAGDFTSLMTYLPDPDPVLRTQGHDIEIYHDITSDAHLWSVMQTRKSGVLSLEWEIDRGKAKSRQAKVIEKLFDNMDLPGLISDILDAPFYGFTVQEVLWKYDSSFLIPDKIISKPQEWFRFNDNKELLFLSMGNPNGEVLTEKNKFLITQFNPAYRNPYGERLLSKCFWPAMFKKGGMKFWLQFIEKYGSPFLLGKYPRGSMTPAEISALLAMLKNMIQNAVAAIPEGSSVEPLEASNPSANSQLYNDFIAFCNAEMSKAILGQTLTTEIGKTGGAYAASQTHYQVKQDIVDTDKRLVEKTINKLIKWIYELNFSESGISPQFIMYEQEQVDKTLAERDEILMRTGVKFRKEYYTNNYGLKEDEFDITGIDTIAVEGEDVEGNKAQAGEVAARYLNGAQIDSAVKIVENVSKGDMPREAGINQLNVFLGLTLEQAEAVMGSAGTGKKLRADKVVATPKNQPIEPPAEFKEADNNEKKIKDFVNSMPPKLIQAQAEQILKPIIDIINKGANYNEIMDNLSKAYPNIKTSQLENLFQKALFSAELGGHINAQE